MTMEEPKIPHKRVKNQTEMSKKKNCASEVVTITLTSSSLHIKIIRAETSLALLEKAKKALA